MIHIHAGSFCQIQRCLGNMESIFNLECLKKALLSKYEIIAVWGAYQILRLDNQVIRSCLGDFIYSPFIDIQDAGLSKIAEIRADEFIPEIIKIFRESEGQVKYSAALVLSKFPNDFSKSLIQRWYERLSNSDQSTQVEFDVSIYAYLKIDHQKNFQHVVKDLIQSQHDSIKSSVLFLNLMSFCESEAEFSTILDQYFILRDINSDAELTFQLVDHFGQMELKNWWGENLLRGYSISSIYEQCYILLGFTENLTDRQYWLELEEAFGESERTRPGIPKDHERFLSVLEKWVEHLLQNTHHQSKLRWVVHAFNRNRDHFPKTIPKIIELETLFLLTVPLLINLEDAVSRWLRKPAAYVEKIAHYYHSSLLIKEYREEILEMFFPILPDWRPEQLKIKHDYSPLSQEETKNEILWMFLRGELLGYDIPWPSIFPNSDYSKHLGQGLSRVFFYNFDYYVRKEDRVAIDYGLKLFQMYPTKAVIQLIRENFGFLVQKHTETLYQTIEYNPDPVFIDLLLQKYEPGEFEVARLIFIICEIFEHPIPDTILKDLETLNPNDLQLSGIKKSVRLHCKICNNTFQYPVDTIYVDEGAILRMNRLSADSVWVPQTFKCKKCHSALPFILDESQLNEFSLQSRVDRILKTTPQIKGQQFGLKIVLIDFPRFEGVTYSPDYFNNLVHKFEQKDGVESETLQVLLMKQAKLYKTMHAWESCLKILLKIQETEENKEELTFLKGLAHYKLQHFIEARKHFDSVIKENQSHCSESSQKVDQSKYFIKVMDSDTSKRARFKLIKGRK